MCVCLAFWGERVCIIPWGPGSCFPHLFSSGFLEELGLGVEVERWCFAQLHVVQEVQDQRHKHMVAVGVGRGSPHFPASTLDHNTGILEELGCSPWQKLLLLPCQGSSKLIGQQSWFGFPCA